MAEVMKFQLTEANSESFKNQLMHFYRASPHWRAILI